MALSNIELLQTQDSDVNQLQINIKKALGPIVGNPIVGGNTMPVTLAVGNNQISHGLNRTILGWSVQDINAPAVIYRNQGSANPAQILVLNSSAIAQITLYVY